MTHSKVRQVRMARFFELLGAPLNNSRWSWGAKRHDGAIFLRQWETDLVTGSDGREFVVVAHGRGPAGPRQNGWRERLEHIAAIRCVRAHAAGRVPESAWGKATPVGGSCAVPMIRAARITVQVAGVGVVTSACRPNPVKVE